jgi:hypothetical protein
MIFYKERKTPRVRELSRDIWARTLTGGERIGAISMYEEREREREIIKYTCDIHKDTKRKGPDTISRPVFPRESLRPELRGLSPGDALNY